MTQTKTNTTFGFTSQFNLLVKQTMTLAVMFIYCVLAVESYDRSTTREYGDLSKDMNDKYQRLKASEDEAVKLSDEHYKSLLKQVRAAGCNGRMFFE